MRILPCEDTGRMQVKAGAEIGGDVLTRQGVPRITGHHKDRRERHGTGSPSEPPKEPILLTP